MRSGQFDFHVFVCGCRRGVRWRCGESVGVIARLQGNLHEKANVVRKCLQLQRVKMQFGKAIRGH